MTPDDDIPWDALEDRPIPPVNWDAKGADLDYLTDPVPTAIEPSRGEAIDTRAEADYYFYDEATAIEPSRVLVLDEDEQDAIATAWLDNGAITTVERSLAMRVKYGERYDSEIDEIARITLRKRRLEGEIKRINQRIADLTDPCVEWLAEHNARNIRHDATGALVARDDTVRLAHRDPDWGTEEKAIAKDAAGEVLAADPSTEAFVQAGWNHRRVESYFRDLYKRRVEAMLELPENERTPVDPDGVIPEALRPFYRLNTTPRVKVTQ